MTHTPEAIAAMVERLKAGDLCDVEVAPIAADMLREVAAERDAAASVAVLVEMRELIRDGKADYHAEPFARHRIAAEQAALIKGIRLGIEAMKKAGHDYWSAGEPDCPSDIKARNGELYKMRCKKCGQDNPPDEACPADLDPNTIAKEAE